MICSAMRIVISGTYGLNDLKADLQSMYNKAGVKDEGVMFLFTNGQITNEKVVVFINDLLSNEKLPTGALMEIKTPFATRIAVGTEAPD